MNELGELNEEMLKLNQVNVHRIVAAILTSGTLQPGTSTDAAVVKYHDMLGALLPSKEGG